MLNVRIRRKGGVSREPAQQLLEVVTPRTNAALISRQSICARGFLHTRMPGGGPLALEVVADGERCRFLIRSRSELQLRQLRGQVGAAYPQAALREAHEEVGLEKPAGPRGLDARGGQATREGGAARQVPRPVDVGGGHLDGELGGLADGELGVKVAREIGVGDGTRRRLEAEHTERSCERDVAQHDRARVDLRQDGVHQAPVGRRITRSGEREQRDGHAPPAHQNGFPTVT